MMHSKRPGLGVCAALAVGVQFVVIVALLAGPADAANYYVATNGSNSNAGTLAHPFLTIQQAANAAHAGDNVYVEGGTYRETVSVPNSGTASAPINFQPYQGAQVTVTGLNLVSSGWTDYSGSTYCTTLAGGGGDVFVNGQMMIGARYPNPVYNNPLCAVYNTIDSATIQSPPATSTITSAALGSPANGTWSGSNLAVVTEPGEMATHSTSITSQTGNNLSFQWTDNIAYGPEAGYRYYLYNSLAALSASKQYYYDSSAGKLYLNAPGGANPNSQTVEVRQRQYGFDLGSQNYVNVSGFRLQAASINVAGNHNVVDNCQILYPTPVVAPTGNMPSGVNITGQYNTVRNSEIGYSWGDGLSLKGGSYNTVNNNVIHDVNWLGVDSSFVDLYYANGNNTVTNNTMYNAGRNGVMIGNDPSLGNPNTQIQHNDISRFGLLTGDLGGIYSTFGINTGSVIAYNNIHDSHYVGKTGTANVGIYMDSGNSGVTVHNNLVSNTDTGITVNPCPTGQPNNVSVYSNTLWNVTNAMATGTFDGYSLTNVSTYNNLSNNGTWVGTDIRNNRYQTANQFTNSAAGDYTLTPNSSGSNQGATYKRAVRYGMTDAQHPVDPYTGATPDAGAFAYGETAWTAGANFQTWLASNQVAAPLASAVNVKQTGGIVTTGSLMVGNTTSTSSNNRSFLNFNLSGIAAAITIQSAILRIYEVSAPASAAGSVTLYRVTSSWTNSSVSYNQSVNSTAISGFYDPSNLDMYTDIDITSWVQSWINNPSTDFGVSLRGIETATETAKYFDGFYGVTAPQLIITIPEPPAVVLLATGVLGLLAYMWRKRKRLMIVWRNWALSLYAVLAASLWFSCATEVLADSGPRPTLRLNVSKKCQIKLWQGENTPILHRTVKGQLALLPGQYSLGKPPHALLSDDQGRTWRPWSDFSAWPKMAYVDVVRLGDELLAFGHNEMDCYKGTYLWRSKDDGLTWTGGKRLTPDADRWAPMNQRMLLTSRGRLVLPIERLLGAEGPDPNQIGTIYSDDAGRSWKRSPIFGPPPPLPVQPEGFGEPATVELPDGRIWMVFRTRYGHLWQAWSSDGGATWGKPSATQLVSPASAVNAKRLPDSDAVIVFWDNAEPGTSTNWNANPNLWRPRSPLVFATSQDGCKTWSRPVVVDPGTAAYPSICFSDREMFVAYWADPDPKAVYLNPKSDLILVVYDLPSLLRFAREPLGGTP